MKTETTMLPEKIVSQTMANVKLEEFNTKLKLMVGSYVRLPFHLSEEALPRNPKLITKERLEEFVKKMQEGLPEEGKNVWQKNIRLMIDPLQANELCRFVERKADNASNLLW